MKTEPESILFPVALVRDPRLGSGAVVLFLVLSTYCDKRHRCSVGIRTLIESLACDRTTVMRWIGNLERADWLLVERSPGECNRYTLKGYEPRRK